MTFPVIVLCAACLVLGMIIGTIVTFVIIAKHGVSIK